MKTVYSALLISALFTLTSIGCQKSQNDAPALNSDASQISTEKVFSSIATEQIISSENGVATATKSVSGDNVTLTLRPAKYNGQDAMILRYDPDPTYANTNKGQEVDIPALTWTAGGVPTYRRSLINFNQLSLIPSTAIIVSAKLYLYGLPPGGSPNCTQGNSSYSGGYQSDACWLQRCTSPWNENTVTWNNQPGIDPLQVAIAQGTMQWNEDRIVNIANFVQSWVNGSFANNGIMMLLQSETQYSSRTFGASENSTNYRPKLVVVFHL